MAKGKVFLTLRKFMDPDDKRSTAFISASVRTYDYGGSDAELKISGEGEDNCFKIYGSPFSSVSYNQMLSQIATIEEALKEFKSAIKEAKRTEDSFGADVVR